MGGPALMIVDNQGIFLADLFGLILSLPIVYYTDLFQHWLGYRAVRFPGADWVTPVLAVAIYLYGGWVFVVGARHELAARTPQVYQEATATLGMVAPVAAGTRIDTCRFSRE